jgi:hypothetical protein
LLHDRFFLNGWRNLPIRHLIIFSLSRNKGRADNGQQQCKAHQATKFLGHEKQVPLLEFAPVFVAGRALRVHMAVGNFNSA